MKKTLLALLTTAALLVWASVVDVAAQGPYSAQIQAALRSFLTAAHTWTATQTFTNITVGGTCTGCGTGAPDSATYITQTPNSSLSAEQAMSALATGLVMNTTTTGVQSIYTGTSCTNQFVRSLSLAGAATCAAASLTADVSGILPTANGGTGIAFFTAAGPTVARVYTFPDAATTVLTTNAPVTVAQGGTGLATLTANNVVLGNGSSTPGFVAPGTSGNVLTSNGTTWTSATPTAGTWTLLKSNSGTSTTASATNVDTVAISGLTAKDTIKIFYNAQSDTQATAAPVFYNNTDAVSLCTTYAGTGTAHAAGDQTISEASIMQMQVGSTTVACTRNYYQALPGGGNVPANSVYATFTTAWTGSWTLAFRTGTGGVTAGGTYRWSWSVYKIAGQ